MILFPAIDIKDGRCVRLFQGDYNRMTTYAEDPVEVAMRWQEAGARWLHVVDLDGAAQGHPVHVELIARIRQATSLKIEVGGGLRSPGHIEHLLSTGIERVILGTVAITDRELLKQALARWDERIAVGIDARNGYVAIAGWMEDSQVKATHLAQELALLGVRRFIYTDIARDGALVGPNLAALSEMQQASPAALIASGGVSSLEDLQALAALGVEGAIIGKALYTGAVDLATAVRVIEKEERPNVD
ncbi:1-(5-phosphoribosyl)-5-[(5-phosphoribosylamino)methylideneamino] imidazole-4-carboxamide isomerase [Thermosporothrix hazakensis]|uniref:1-(5-phosphoribosyl)-5-[(5-phosphoribosylamino)methylideneamino] imidazole-4-carboxamide isomerase n=2 Tax=Thermosporothrix TaxID=768650 RepID=A0A326U9E9_THEHA|nr:1-(5-phosphoribosyl)-5-[(5-phosphoribosylamino)methylideneamino]imidazole-4-carboxamide isomerase [Thermosporothrix hazakensis]PZW32057.1 1-(5-phosphoribosyl)-5-[(5-phosphoribosylamino)methylideneamino] imidazole-4-carboxamide isomerase [Thermosporothrix hazakensis]BBH91470.1 1-(5-phosphoribosyl)-5-[(5-phosphoribosylamino) methylideneamino] imidazole-4-carboxamide isomerase [Thermosporothrix sp. COM3]GCE49615.1 1-(5-phosphoribosyl)-5-[(5-phosphoribosylamino) methylideneamino] imidazole-4-carb